MKNDKDNKKIGATIVILLTLAIYFIGMMSGVSLGIPCIIVMLLAWAWARGSLTIEYGTPKSSREIDGLEKVTRFEVIDETGRLMVEYLDEDVEASAQLQDHGRTLKIYLRHESEEEHA